ncbi:hypothetical protein Enr8_21180 [Blastopirellula retiformator]|uniref:Thioredoxin domain-containing protein n=2 Tax=Blastopirellula retiformator TaxID=2527970 RepID=A0A5C5VAR5_9BACT|nr:hypothetical protein Enr8_21180 [Blastopirellula retiformator]
MVMLLATPAIAAADDGARAKAAVCLAYASVVKDVPDLIGPIAPTPEVAPAQPISYRDAYALYKSQRRPMVVMVTASWCPYCPAMKRELLTLQRDDKLPSASLVIVDYDADRATARTVMGSRRTLPALAVFHYVGDKPKQTRPTKASEVTKILAQ